MRMRSTAQRFRADCAGAAAVEFAFVAPVLLLMVIGALDIGHKLYTRSVLEGETQRAARSSALETASDSGTQAAIDAKVEAAVRLLAGDDAVVTFSRKAYGDYQSATIKAEEYIDANTNGECDNGESFEDVNGDGEWSADGGRTGTGNGRDVQQYTITIQYDRKFPTSRMLGWDSTETLSVTTLLKNQPYSDQTPPTVLTCD